MTIASRAMPSEFEAFPPSVDAGGAGSRGRIPPEVCAPAASEPAGGRTNPKDLIGQAKVDLSLFPPAGLIHGAHAMMDGATKYGPYNWRERDVKARVYISAAQRHLADYLDGQDEAEDSGCHHLGHAIACCAIILDAFEVGALIDDRPATGRAVEILDRLNAKIMARRRSSPT